MISAVRWGHTDVTHWLRPVADALDAAPAPVVLCFRDDDAGWSDTRLLRLLDRFAAAAVPLDLAVIPAALDRPLAAELLGRAGTGLRLHQHGYLHVSHEPAGRKCEFGPARSRRAQRRDIVAGRVRLAELLGEAVDPVFTPPWNRCTADTGCCLAELGYRVLSRESRAEPLRIPALREVPVHVDWVRLGPAAAAERLAAAVRHGGPTGVMFHHAEMDTASRDAVSALLALTAGHDRARPQSLLRAGAARHAVATAISRGEPSS